MKCEWLLSSCISSRSSDQLTVDSPGTQLMNGSLDAVSVPPPSANDARTGTPFSMLRPPFQPRDRHAFLLSEACADFWRSRPLVPAVPRLDYVLRAVARFVVDAPDVLADHPEREQLYTAEERYDDHDRRIPNGELVTAELQAQIGKRERKGEP